MSPTAFDITHIRQAPTGNVDQRHVGGSARVSNFYSLSTFQVSFFFFLFPSCKLEEVLKLKEAVSKSSTTCSFDLCRH